MSRSHSWVVLVLLCSSTRLQAAQDAPPAKQVAAPPADVEAGLVRLPDPSTVPTRSSLALRPLVAPQSGPAAFEHVVPLERAGAFALALVAPDAASWTVAARPGASAEVELGLIATSRRSAALEWPLAGQRALLWELAAPGPGELRVVLRAPSGVAGWRGTLVVLPGGPAALEAHLASHELLSDRPVGLVARALEPGAPAPKVLEARLVYAFEGGPEGSVAMADDGRHGDGLAGDGTYGARLPAGIAGEVSARVELRGRDGSGALFERTSWHRFPVLEPVAALDGRVLTELAGGALAIELGVRGSAERLHVSAEVWGTLASGELVPVAWLSRMATPESRPGGPAVALTLDLRWLALAGAGAPLELRHVRLQDPGTHVPFDRRARLDLATDPLPDVPAPAAPTREMLMGSVALEAPAADLPLAPLPRALLLVHGYCSSGVWPPADFSQPKLEFLDPDANRTHDEFALLIASATGDLRSFGVVAHSQGGMAALHLYTYYPSGLDHALGERRIQSVGSPYQGTPLAALGDVIPGVGCGANFDMTPDGSALWLAGIPSWARAEVSYWTTSEGGFLCSLATFLLLPGPDDGVVQQSAGQLPGGVSMGHTTGWCHTTEMEDPAHYLDHARNVEMDAAAAR